MELHDLMKRAIAVRQRYAELEKQTYGRSWTAQEVALGFVGDVGDLMKLVMAQSGVRHIPDVHARLSHELADCLWCVLVLSHSYGIDLEQAFLETMDSIEQSMTE